MPSDLVAAALKAYASTEPRIHAWVEVSPQEPLGEGPLNGIPFGVKDIFETTGLRTEYGSALYAGRRGQVEAPIVTRLRRLGAVLFGKTQTTAFAYFDPPPTRNPRNVAHTPGGSSSGSAAAVAAGVVPFALGTQTMGSVVRPASFCGIVGFKPTFGALPCEGVLPFAPSLDTVGLLAADVETCAKVWHALGFGDGIERPLCFGIPANLPAVSAEMEAAFEAAIGLLRQRYPVHRIELPQPYDALLAAARIVNDYEGARSHVDRWREFGTRVGEKLSELVVRGIRISESEYRDSLRRVRDAAESMDRVFSEFPVLLTPAALGSAPLGLASTGDPAMNAVWTAMGTPAISIPMPQTHRGLPLGLQLIGAQDTDAVLLRVAKKVSASLTEIEHR
jgi:Asp-tRNA(Asn)/Glu-tRNA(Gln) amidotransferase A subunit family amidase